MNHDARPGYNFRSWKYTIFKARFLSDPDVEKSKVLLDSGCGVTLRDRAYLQKYMPNLEIKKMAAPLLVRGVGNKIVYISEYALVKIYVRGII